MNRVKYYRLLPNGEIHTEICYVTQDPYHGNAQGKRRMTVREMDDLMKRKGYSRKRPSKNS